MHTTERSVFMKTVSTFSERLKYVMEQRGLSYRDLEKITGLAPQTLNRYVLGQRVPKIDVAKEIAERLNVNILWLQGYDVQMFSDVFSIPGISPPPKMVKKPRLGTISCGLPALALEEEPIYDFVPEHIKCDYTLLCKGDSMTEARINDGDIVYIREQPDVDNGEIACVVIEDEATLKKVYKYPGMVQLVAANPNYAPLVYTENDAVNIRIIGKAVGFTSEI